MSLDPRPQLVVIAGPNGAGKTSAAPELLRDTIGIETFVNADVIAAGLSAFRPEAAALEAGRIMLARLRDLARAGRHIAFESTLSGLSGRRLLTELMQVGYETHIYYLWLPSADLAVARVLRRVESGGHDVPEAVIRRRFGKSIVNFDRIYRPIVSSWRLYDGSALGVRLIASGTGTDEPSVRNKLKWRRFRGQIEEFG